MRYVVCECSRCRKEQKNDAAYWQTFWAQGIEYDLCWACFKAFKEFMKEEEG
jgi:hypothetical protein